MSGIMSYPKFRAVEHKDNGKIWNVEKREGEPDERCWYSLFGCFLDDECGEVARMVALQLNAKENEKLNIAEAVEESK